MIASMLGSARGVSSNLNGLAELLRQAVVEVRSGESGSGTGIIWGGAGLVVTNAHCIRRGAPLKVDSGGELSFTLYWQAIQPLDMYYSVTTVLEWCDGV